MWCQGGSQSTQVQRVHEVRVVIRRHTDFLCMMPALEKNIGTWGLSEHLKWSNHKRSAVRQGDAPTFRGGLDHILLVLRTHACLFHIWRTVYRAYITTLCQMQTASDKRCFSVWFNCLTAFSLLSKKDRTHQDTPLSTTVTNLGVRLDPHLTLENHTKHLFKTCFSICRTPPSSVPPSPLLMQRNLPTPHLQTRPPQRPAHWDPRKIPPETSAARILMSVHK